jgi:CheY-like chemotaxis protein
VHSAGETGIVGYILFAEDDAMSQRLVREMIEVLGYEVRVADNGADALAMALAERPALMLLDVLMPARSGLEVTRAVRQHYGPQSPTIILITALGSLQDVEQGKLSGADGYIIKPFSASEFKEIVRQVMAGS